MPHWILILIALAVFFLAAVVLLVLGLLHAAGQQPPTPGPDRDDGEVK